MNEFQQIWLEAYRGYLNAASPFGEHHTSEYTAAREHADAAISSLSNLKAPIMQQRIPTIDMGITVDMSRIVAAIQTLESSGYTYNGGKLWKPPVGKAPAYLTEWNGEGLPPVRCEVEFHPVVGLHYRDSIPVAGTIMQVVHHYFDAAVCVWTDDQSCHAETFTPQSLKPIQITPEQERKAEASRMMRIVGDSKPEPMNPLSMLGALALYDAGYRMQK